MKKSVLALSVAAALGGLASTPAGAQVASTDLIFNPKGVGHIVIVPYYSTQAGNSTKINIYNTDTVNGKALKVRFRGASNSDDVFDFQVFLSPGDVWTASIDQDAAGLSKLTTTDKSCTVPASVNAAFVTTRLNPALTGDALANETREGYVEILNMGDIVTGAGSAIFNATKHKDGVAPCTRSVLDSLAVGDTRLAVPTTGLMANWTIVNVPNTTVWGGEAAAIEARSSTGAPAAGNRVYWPQLANGVTPAGYTADPLFLTGAVQAAQYDLPDLSTPYTTGSTCPFCQANRLSHSISARQVAGEYLSDPAIGASTDWVVSMPTRRYYAAVDYTGSVDDGPVIVTTHDDFFISEAVYFRDGNMSLGNASNGGKNYQACVQVTSIGFWNREEGSPLPDGPIISPGQPKQPPWLCGEVSVVGINSPVSPLGASVARVNVTVPGFLDGWGLLTTNNAHLYNGAIQNWGLPMLVNQFSKAVNPAVKPGVSGTFGANYPGRTLLMGTEPEFVITPVL